MEKVSLQKRIAQALAIPMHKAVVNSRRIETLASLVCAQLPTGELSGVDIGCGSGELGKRITELCSWVSVTGTELQPRESTLIEVIKGDAESLPFNDRQFDFALLIDVLHHTVNPASVLREAIRVSNRFVLVKDHVCESLIDHVTLSFMDWVGNRAYDVALPESYPSSAEWQTLFEQCSVVPTKFNSHLNLYAPPLTLIFDRKLHFFAKLERRVSS